MVNDNGADDFWSNVETFLPGFKLSGILAEDDNWKKLGAMMEQLVKNGQRPLSSVDAASSDEFYL